MDICLLSVIGIFTVFTKKVDIKQLLLNWIGFYKVLGIVLHYKAVSSSATALYIASSVRAFSLPYLLCNPSLRGKVFICSAEHLDYFHTV